MLKSLIVTTTLTGSLLVGSLLWQEIQPNVENTVSYTSLDNVLKNASFLRDLGDENALKTSFSEVVKDIPNLEFDENSQFIKYATETSCYIGYLTQDYYKISVC